MHETAIGQVEQRYGTIDQQGIHQECPSNKTYAPTAMTSTAYEFLCHGLNSIPLTSLQM
jgi:hypothetical protein